MSGITQSGGGPEIVTDAAGKDWSLSHVGPRIRRLYSAWCKARAWAALAGSKEHESEEAHRESRAALIEQVAAGGYDWGSPLDPRRMGAGLRAHLQSDEGKVKLLQLLLAETHGEVPVEQVVKLFVEADPEALGDAIARCLGVDPNAKAPAASPSSGKEKATPAQGSPTGT